MAVSFPDLPAPCTSLVELLRTRASRHGSKTVFSFLENGELELEELDYAGLDADARRIAAALQELGMAGERALLYYPAGLEFLRAFVGCLYAGTIAVPTSPPLPGRPVDRLHSVIQDAGAALVLTHSSVLHQVQDHLGRMQLDGAPDCLATDTDLDCSQEHWQPMRPGERSLAFLQYTSGSTSTPKGVMVSHGNLLHNTRMIQAAFQQNNDSVLVSWLPLFHDMGLIGTALNALTLGSHCVLMAPEAFLMKPVRWLQAISRYRAHTSGGPNFGYELCARKVLPEQQEELDLSCWELAFNGSERVRPRTIERFASCFAPMGFQPHAMFPCYGLAEGTLYASGGMQPAAPVVSTFEASALEAGRAVLATCETERALDLVGCGQASLGQEILVVDPETGEPVPDGTVGEVWVRGGSVALGYWKREELSVETFGNTTPAGKGPFLRTGDLGFFSDGELYLAGRLKDLIIIAGKNHHPEDLELTVESCHSAVRPGCVAAYAFEHDGEEFVGIALEGARDLEFEAPEEPDQVRRHPIGQAVVEGIAEAHELRVRQIDLLPAGHLPKTSSGKVQRHACRVATEKRQRAAADA